MTTSRSIKMYKNPAEAVLIGNASDFSLPSDQSIKIFTAQNPFKRGRILLVNKNNKFYASSNVCPHQGGPLSSGLIVDIEDIAPCDTNSSHPVIECPIHSWQFDMQTGACLSNKYVIDTYDVYIDDDKIYLTPATNTNIVGPRRDFNGNEMVKSSLGWI